jgi:hypothetical protein
MSAIARSRRSCCGADPTVTRDPFKAFRGNPSGLYAFRAEFETLSIAGGVRPRSDGLRANPWQRAILGEIDDARTRSFFYEGPRGCGKSQEGGFVGVERVTLLFDHSVTIHAYDLDQARHIVSAAHGIVRRNAILSDSIEILRDGIRCEATGSSMRAMPADAPGAFGHGARASTFMCDEVSTWPNRELADAILSAVPKHPGSQALFFSNAGSFGSPGWELRSLHETSDDPAIKFFLLDYSRNFPSWLSRFEIDRQRKLLTAREFARLWEGSWLAGEDSCFRWSDIERCLIDEDLDAAA